MTTEVGRDGRNERPGLQARSATVLSDRAVGLLAVASAVAVANAYYIQPLLVDVGGALSISSGFAGILPGLSQIGLACGLAFLLPLGDIVSARRLLLTVIPIQVAALVLFALSGSAFTAACDRSQATDHVFGQLPGRQAMQQTKAPEEKRS